MSRIRSPSSSRTLGSRQDREEVALTTRGALVHRQGHRDECVALANRYAPEHLIIASDDADAVSKAVSRTPERHLSGALHARGRGRLPRRAQPRAAHRWARRASSRRSGWRTFLKRTSITRFEPPKLRELGGSTSCGWPRSRASTGHQQLGRPAHAEDPPRASRAGGRSRSGGGARAVSGAGDEAHCDDPPQDEGDGHPASSSTWMVTVRIRRLDRNSLLRPHARVVHEATALFDLRLRAVGDLAMWTRTTPSRTWASRWARR